MKKTKDYRRGWFAHVHHLGPVIEWSDNIEERFEYIRTRKPEKERELRAALIIRVPDELIPVKLRRAGAAYDRAEAAYRRAGAAYDKAWAAYCKVQVANSRAWAVYDKAQVANSKAGAAYDKAWAAYCRAKVAYDRARAACDRVRAACDKTWAACDKAKAAHDKAWAAHYEAWAACDWESIYAQIKLANSPWDGHTIFSRGKGIEAIL